jgi:hypothetical protein
MMIGRWDRRRGHTANRMAMAANIAFAGGNDCRMTIMKKEPRLMTLDVLDQYPRQEQR